VKQRISSAYGPYTDIVRAERGRDRRTRRVPLATPRLCVVLLDRRRGL